MKIQINNFTQSIFETTLPIDNKLYNKIKKQKLKKYEELQSSYFKPIDKILFNEVKDYLQEYINPSLVIHLYNLKKFLYI